VVVYCGIRDDKIALKKVKTNGQATPIVLKEEVTDATVPAWSPDGHWIAIGSNLVSQDGQATKPLSPRRGAQYTFSADGKYVYSIRSDQERRTCFGSTSPPVRKRSSATSGGSFSPAAT